MMSPMISDRTPAERSKRPILLGAALGIFAALLLAIIAGAVYIAGQRAPRLTRAELDAAIARWEKNGPADYDLDLELSGNRPGRVHVEVRRGEVAHMTRDGVEPKQKRTWDVWSVPGQLETIEQELDMAEKPAPSYGAPGASEVVMWARFDPRYGVPMQFDRVVLGADLEVHWKVTRFDVMAEKK